VKKAVSQLIEVIISTGNVSVPVSRKSSCLGILVSRCIETVQMKCVRSIQAGIAEISVNRKARAARSTAARCKSQQTQAHREQQFPDPAGIRAYGPLY
jgi:hypothetical protein